MRNKLIKNLGLKILALITAIVLWLVVVNISDPVISTTFSDVPVEIVNANLLASEGKVYQVLDGTDKISITVAAKRSILDYLNNSNLHATADMQELNESDGTIRIRVEANRYNNQIDSIKPKTEYLRMEIEDKKNAQFPIQAVVLGEPTEGYVVGEVGMNQNIVIVSGPESLVSKIDKVKTEVSVEGMSSDVSTNMKLKYYDADGKLLDHSRLNSNISSVDLDVEILETKEVPVVVNVSGTPKEGYGINGVAMVEPATVVIAGRSSALNGVESIQIAGEKVNVEGLEADLNVAVKLKDLLPDGVTLADSKSEGKAVVSVKIETLISQSVELPKAQIAIDDIPQGYVAEFITDEEMLNLEITGLEEAINNLDISLVKGTINVKAYIEENKVEDIGKGIHMLPITLEFPDGIVQKAPVSIGVKFSEKEE